MGVPHLVNGLPPCIASTDFRRNTSDHIFFTQLSLIAFTPDVDDVPRFAYRMPPSHQQIYLSLSCQMFFSSYPSDAGTVTNGKRARFKIQTPSQPTACFVQRRVAVLSENYRAHFAKRFSMINFVRQMASDSCVNRVVGRFPLRPPQRCFYSSRAKKSSTNAQTTFVHQHRLQRLQHLVDKSWDRVGFVLPP